MPKQSESFKANPGLKLFFSQLLDLKRYCETQSENMDIADYSRDVYEELFKKLDTLIKETK